MFVLANVIKNIYNKNKENKENLKYKNNKNQH